MNLIKQLFNKRKQYGIAQQFSHQFPEVYNQQRAFLLNWQGEKLDESALLLGKNISGTKQKIFWCFQCYHELANLAHHLGPDQPLYGMRSGHRVMQYTPANATALAKQYLKEIKTIQPKGPYILGGNCQAVHIIWKIAQMLLAEKEHITLLAMMEQVVPELYRGNVALLFGEQSIFNPYKKFHSPEIGISRFYPGKLSIDLIPENHGHFFEGQAIEKLAEFLKFRIKCAEAADFGRQINRKRCRGKIQSVDHLILHSSESKSFSVTIKNISNTPWPKGKLSGITLLNTWLDCWHQTVTLKDSQVYLPNDLLPAKSIEIDLMINAPEKPGQYYMKLNLAIEGMFLFNEKSSKAKSINVTVK